MMIFLLRFIHMMIHEHHSKVEYHFGGSEFAIAGDGIWLEKEPMLPSQKALPVKYT